MEINVKWTGKILNLPASVSDFAPDASREELIVIIGLFSCAEYFDAFDKYIDVFSEKIGIGVERVMSALSFWADKGVISLEGELPADIAFSRIDNILTGDQIKKFVENNESIRSLFFASQKILAREFNLNNTVLFEYNYDLNDFKIGNDIHIVCRNSSVDAGVVKFPFIFKSGSFADIEFPDVFADPLAP